MAVREQPQGNLDVPAHAAVEARDLTRVYGEGETAVEALRGVDIAAVMRKQGLEPIVGAR